MARIFITGSADGLGQLAAKALIAQGHHVLLHARNEKRSNDALNNVPGAAGVVSGDLSDMEETKQLADKINASGKFDAVIHNAGVYQTSAKLIFAVNTLAPYILTCLVQKSKRFIYLTSGMQMQGKFQPRDFKNGGNHITYSDSKLHVVMLCNAVARKWPEVYSNAVNPGWVPTRMGGAGAPDDLQKGYETQMWLATSNDEQAKVSGKCFFHRKETRSNPLAHDVDHQEAFLQVCQEITGVSFPG
jgi:NAD(P)-dependent dehydrogenase (short-subunit alcohol dehydrogenase family)